MKNIFYIVKNSEVLDFTTSLRTAKDAARKAKADLIIECLVLVSIHVQEIQKLRAYIFCSNIGIFETRDWAEFAESFEYKYIFSHEAVKLVDM